MADTRSDVGRSHVCDIRHQQNDLTANLLPKDEHQERHRDTKSKKWNVVVLTQKVAAETIASFMVVFLICAAKANSMNTGMFQGLEVGVIGGLVVMVTIFSVGHVSGSHINPAVTIAYAAIKHFPLRMVPLYLTAHLVGAILASLLLGVIFSPLKHIDVVSPPAGVLQAFLAEVIAGFLLLFVASAVSTDTRAIGQFAGIAVGAVITIDILFAAPISGGGINPARALGPAIVARKFEHVWIYIVGPITGALIGALMYKLLRSEEGEAQRKAAARSRNLFPPKHSNSG